MSHWDEFDHVIINDDLAHAADELMAVLGGEGDASATSNPALRAAVTGILSGE